MKREISRKTPLPPFSIGLAELELIWRRLESHFGSDPVSMYVDIGFAHEKLTFDTVGELQTATFPRANSTDFTLHCHGGKAYLHIYTPPHSGMQQATLVASADSDVWEAGAREIVLTVINQNRVWHHWLSQKIFAGLLVGVVFSLGLGLGFFGVSPASKNVAALLGAAIAVFLLLMLYVGRHRVLPTATLRLIATEYFWRRYSLDLTLGLSLLAVLISIWGVFAGGKP